MFINNVITKAIPTAGLSFPLAEGSVVTAGGVTGIVMENVAQASPTAMIYIAIGGTIDLCSEANKGVSFTDEQIKALGSDFNFIPAEEGGGSSLPEVTAADNGDVLTVVDGAWAKAEAPSGLPDYTDSDIGKALVVGSVPVTTTLVDETVTLDEESHEGPLSDPSALASLSEGDSVVFTLGEKTVTLTVESDSGDLLITDDGDGIYWKIDPDPAESYAFVYNVEGGTFHVKLETAIQETAAEWDFLTVDKAPFIVQFSESGGVYSADKTFSQIVAAYASNVVLFQDLSDQLTVAHRDRTAGQYMDANAVAVNTLQSKLIFRHMRIDYNNNVTYTVTEYTLTPVN